MARLRNFALLAAAVAAVGCVPKPEAPPAVEPAPAPTPAPAPPPPAAADWRDIPLTPGDWRYGTGSGAPLATFGAGNQPLFTVQCDAARRQIVIERIGTAAGNTLTLRTSFGSGSLPLTVETGTPGQLAARLAATDKLLDDIAFSRGRFTVVVPGQDMLVIPAYPEPARVIEDCRSS